MTEVPPSTQGATPDPEARPRGSSGRVWYVAVAGVLVVAIAVVWALGGFQRQPRQYEIVEVGSTIATGPFEFVFTSATAQRIPQTSYQDATVKILVSGTARTTGNETITPTVGSSGMFQAYDRASGVGDNAYAQKIGDGGPAALTPGLPAIPYEVEFRFPATFQPGKELTFGVISQRYTATSLIQTEDDEKTWHNGNGGYQLDVPLEVLPDAKN